MAVALELNHVWKKFHRGEFNDCLRDAIPALVKGVFGFGHRKGELAEKDFWALADVDFKVEEGETLGIIGHNGAGKSTLLKILSNILEPNRGNMKVNGRLRSLIEVGAGFHGDLTGRENIFLNGAILGMTREEIQKNFDSIVDFSGVEAFLDTPVKRYSSGMAARLGFAVAAHLEPEILIVDEVLSVGDAAFQKKCLGKMSAVAGEGRTVLFVSHNMAAVQKLCSRAILLEHGKILMDGETRDVISRYYGILEEEEMRGADGEIIHRSGNGWAKVQNVFIGTERNTLSKLGICDSGSELYIRVEYQKFQDVPNPVIQVVFGDVMDYTFEVNTRITPEKLESLGEKGYVEFHIPFLPLAPGEYPLYVTIKDRTLNGPILIVDEFPHAALLKVDSSNALGYDLRHGFYGRNISPFSWTHQS